MFRAFHEKREEAGFTLIELLVVILIIAILAAIAIPVFLNQRRKGWISQAESALKNAATAQESWATGPGDGAYTNSVSDLRTEGFRYATTEITFTVDFADLGEDYCMEADSTNDNAIDLFYLSDNGRPTEGECPADAD